MRTSLISHNRVWTFGLVLLSSIFLGDTVWSQGGPPRDRRSDRRNDRMRGDPTSFLVAIRDDVFAKTLKLSKDQEDQLRKLRYESYGLFQRGLSSTEMAQAMKELDDKGLALLDAEQKSTWEKRKQEIIAAVAKSEETPVRTESSSPAGVIRSDTAPATARGTIPDEKPPEGEIAVISFGAAVPEKKLDEDEQPDAVDPNVSSKPATGSKEEPKLMFNFRYAPWADVLKLFADLNELTLDLNDVPPGTFNYYDNGRRYTMTEALDILNGYLLSKGYVLVRRDRFLVCLNIADNPIPPNVVPSVTEEELPQRGKNELLSLVLPLPANQDAEKMVSEVKELLGPQNKVSALKSSNSLVMMDIGSNLQRVARLLKVSTPPVDKGETVFKAIALKHITAADAERTVRRLFDLNPPLTTAPQVGFGGRGGFGGGGFGGFGGGGFGGRGGRDGGGGGFDPGGGGVQPGQGGGGAPMGAANTSTTPSPFRGKIQVTADVRTNHLLVTAPASLVKVVEDVVKSLDVNEGSDGQAINKSNSPTYFQAYPVPGSDSTSMARVLGNLLPGVIVGDDPRSGKIFAQGTKEEHAEVARLLKATGDAQGSVAVIQLTKLDPSQVTNSLRNLFINDGTRAPSIEADMNGRRILVRGTADQLVQVKSLLRDLGETSGSVTDGNVNGIGDDTRGNIRQLNIGNQDPNVILDVLQKTWGASGHSPIRIVIPGQPNPVRDRLVPRGAPVGSPEDVNPFPRRAIGPDSSRTEPTDRSGDDPKPSNNRLRDDSENRKAPEAPRAEKRRPVTTQIYPRRVQAIPVKQIAAEEPDNTVTPAKEEADDTPDEPQPSALSNDNPPTEIPSGAAPDTPRKPQVRVKPRDNGSDDPVSITIMGNDLIITGSNPDELDHVEELLNTLMAAMPQRPRWTVFYLRTADATECAQMLERLFPQSSVQASPVGADGMFGGLTRGLSSLGSGMMSATGLNQTLGGAQNLRIITDVRSNALFVTGPLELIRDVESILEILDASEVPGVLRDRVPRSIPVHYADIDEVAEIIESVFKDSMTPEQAQQGPQGFNPLAAMFGGGRGGGGNNQNKKPQSAELSLGVDKRTSHLIVSCNETLFRRIETMVQAIDDRAKEARRTVRVVELKTADPVVVQSTLTSLIPKVTVSATRPSSRKKTQDNTQPGATGQQPAQPPAATRDQDIMRRMMEQNAGGNSGGGRGFGGNRGGGGFQGGGFQGGGGGSRRGGN